MKTVRFFSWIIFLLLVCFSAQAKTVLSLDQCLQIARTKSPQAIGGLLTEQKARAADQETRSLRLPRLSTEGVVSTSDDPTTQLPDANKGVLRVEQRLYPFSPDWVKADQSSSLLRAAGFSKLESEQDVELLVKQLYFAILRDQYAIQSYLEVEEEFHRLQKVVLPKYTVGRVPPFDLIKVKISISDLERSREITQAQLIGERKRLSLILGLAQDSDLELKALSVLPELPVLTEPELIFQNPTLLSLSEQMNASKLGLKSAKLSRFPSILGAAEYGYSGQTVHSMSRGWDVSLGLKLPLWDWNVISSQIKQQRADFALSQSKLELEHQRVRSDLVKMKAIAQAHLADEKRVKALFTQVKQAAHVSLTRYRQGASGILEVSDSMSLWLQTALNEQNAYYGYLSDLAQIERLTGKSDVRYE